MGEDVLVSVRQARPILSERTGQVKPATRWGSASEPPRNSPGTMFAPVSSNQLLSSGRKRT